LPRLDAERDDVLDLEVDRIADVYGVHRPLLAHLDRRPLDAEVLADERPERLHRPAERSAEDAAELLRLLVGSGRVDEHADAPVAVGHHLWRLRDRGDLETADVDALDLAVLHVEDEDDAAVVVRRPERERRGAGADDVARARLEIGA